jgi:hypothetical protein
MVDGLDWPTADADFKARWTDASSLVSINSSGGVYGGGCAIISGSGGAGNIITKTWTSTDHILLNLKVKLVLGSAAYTANTEQALLQFQGAGGTARITLSYDPNTDTLRLRANSIAGTQLGSNDTGSNIKDGNWHYFEWKILLGSSSNGSSKLKIDGTERTNLTVTSTTTTSTTGDAPKLGIFSLSQTTGTKYYNTYIDDLMVNDWSGGAITDFIGNHRIATLRPASDSSVAWTPDTGGTNYTQVDKSQFANSHYVKATAVGNIDLYGVTSWATYGFTPHTIYALQPVALGEKLSGTSCTVATVLKSGSTTDTAGAVTFAAGSTPPSFANKIYETDPNTSASWTAGNAQSVTTGPKEVAATGSGIAQTDMMFLEVLGSDQGGTNYPFAFDVGTFTLTGEALTISLALKFALGVGTFLLSGKAITIQAGKNFVLGAGSFLLSGKPLTFNFRWNFALGTGAFTLTGQAIKFALNRLFKFGTGAFTLTGQAITIWHGLARKLAPGTDTTDHPDLYELRQQNASLFSLRGVLSTVLGRRSKPPVPGD